MVEEKNLTNNVPWNQNLTDSKDNIPQLPDNVTRILNEKHWAVSEFVNLDFSEEIKKLEKSENLVSSILRFPRDRFYSILWITIPPEFFSKMTETLIKQRQILDLNSDNSDSETWDSMINWVAYNNISESKKAA